MIAARQPHWINTLLYPPYLTQSPAEVYLKGYYPDAVGMSATEKPSHESGMCLQMHVEVFDYKLLVIFVVQNCYLDYDERFSVLHKS